VSVYTEAKGTSDEVWVLLHGIGATGAAWSEFEPLLRKKIHCRSIVIDLPGHGASSSLNLYTEDDIAMHVSDAIRSQTNTTDNIILFGHSYGGTISNWISTGWYGILPKLCLCLGLKTKWSDIELNNMRKLATKPVRVFTDEASAYDFYARASGVLNSDRKFLERGVSPQGADWVLSTDPQVYAISRPPIQELLTSSVCPIYFARGANDQMVDLDMLLEFQRNSESLASGGHSAIVDAPQTVLEWALRCRSLHL